MTTATSSSAWSHAIAHLLAKEGGHVNNPSDPGGETNYGISLRFLKHEAIDVDHDGDVDADDIKKLTIAQASQIYRKNFWEANRYDLLPTPIAIKALDMCVNMGPAQAHKILQKALWGFGFKVKVDGVLGAQTWSAINLVSNQNPEGYLAAIRLLQDSFYTNLCAKRPSLSTFLKGWLNRTYSC